MLGGRKKKEITFWASDFETTVWTEEMIREAGHTQNWTEVWAAASTRLYDESEEVIIQGNIRDYIQFIITRPGNNVFYFHNIAFDGSFIVDFLLRNGWTWTNEKEKNMRSRQFTTSISLLGSWYTIKLKYHKKVIEMRNSLKLIPSSLEVIGKSFKTKHKKLSMNYEGRRYANCAITDEELAYIKNDVLVLKEALEKMFDEGHNKLTIGSCCLEEFKSTYGAYDYERMFPDLREDPIMIDDKITNIWEYCHKAYHGGWCYVNPKYRGIPVAEGSVYDVNSLYPSVMHSSSGNVYPYGHGEYCLGAPGIDLLEDRRKFYYIRVRCRFHLKRRKFPWMHIRGDANYRATENLYTTDVKMNGKYYRYYRDIDGNKCDTIREFTFTKPDWELFQETYDTEDLEILDHVWFWAKTGLFDDYINRYKEMKETSTGFLRTLAKLFLNNLYGKFAMSDDSSYKEPYLDPSDNTIHFILHEEHNKKVGYIAVGAAVTSYALNFTIRAAMENYDRFLYADTDSNHLLGFEPPNGMVIHPTNFNAWKNESKFESAIYERQKTYLEVLIEKDGEPLEKPYYDLKAAGMGKGAKEAFLERGYGLTDFKAGLELDDCNLKAVRIPGGILLTNKTFKMRKPIDKKVCVM